MSVYNLRVYLKLAVWMSNPKYKGLNGKQLAQIIFPLIFIS